MNLPEQASQLITILLFVSLMPLLVVIGTSFLKIAVVFALLRNALGIQQIPPNIALYGLSLILSIFIMFPIIASVHQKLESNESTTSTSLLARLNDGALDPYRDFLKRNSSQTQVHFFRTTATKNWPAAYRDNISERSLLVLMPAFAISQLVEAFKIGLLLFLPFVAIDLIVSNILLAMGMMMVSPMTISLPFKILVFVLIGGWDKVMSQLLLSYH